jgi:hypothetical protein
MSEEVTIKLSRYAVLYLREMCKRDRVLLACIAEGLGPTTDYRVGCSLLDAIEREIKRSLPDEPKECPTNAGSSWDKRR